jgi:hypothetical protein
LCVDAWPRPPCLLVCRCMACTRCMCIQASKEWVPAPCMHGGVKSSRPRPAPILQVQASRVYSTTS